MAIILTEYELSHSVWPRAFFHFEESKFQGLDRGSSKIYFFRIRKYFTFSDAPTNSKISNITQRRGFPVMKHLHLIASSLRFLPSNQYF